ncbi:MAG TPA: hypothetical protein VHD95_06300 [Rhizomicrobium sp.]|nr:hypothetical protein [Rhizomicrobium sp.]
MSENLANLAKIGKLKTETFSETEFKGLVVSAGRRLTDARNSNLAKESRFDLAYNASHSLALAALRRHGYRSENRAIVFQALQHTVGMPAAQWRVLSKCHDLRNLAEYEGFTEVDTKLLDELINIAIELEALVVAGK